MNGHCKCLCYCTVVSFSRANEIARSIDCLKLLTYVLQRPILHSSTVGPFGTGMDRIDRLSGAIRDAPIV